jgi:hypothetical protein
MTPPPDHPVLPGLAAAVNRHKLRRKEQLFVTLLLGEAEFNATRAYHLAGYKPGRANAARLLRKRRIQLEIADRFNERVVELTIMSGDEALTRISNVARSDIGKVLSPEHPIAKLPPEVRAQIKSVTPIKGGGFKVEMYDALRAAEMMAKAGGKLKETVKLESSLEDIVAAVPPGEGEPK